MERVVQETELERTERALAESGVAFPLAEGTVEIIISPEVAASGAGQKLLTLMVNELARMKGVVAAIHLPRLAEVPITEQLPLQGASVGVGLEQLVESLNHPASPLQSKISFAAAPKPTVTVAIGHRFPGALRVGADGWRALLGAYADQADWSTRSPIGPCLAAALASTEVFKGILEANCGADPRRHLVDDLAFSAFDYGIGPAATKGPSVTGIDLTDWVVVGCGAGGTAALYVLAMSEGLSGTLALVEPSSHKLSNLNRYLIATAADVHDQVHKLDSVERHLTRFVPDLVLDRHASEWEQVPAPPWPKIISTVDTVEARWSIQTRARAGAEIIDAAVMGLYYGLLRVIEGGWCLECKHSYDPDHAIKVRAKRWGQTPGVVRAWEADNIAVTESMIERMAEVQGRPGSDWDRLLGLRFQEVPALTECGDTPLRTDLPSPAPVLPLATTAAGVMVAAEVAKGSLAPEAGLANWWGHDLGEKPAARNLRTRPARRRCPRHH